jgi:hypothetical protein
VFATASAQRISGKLGLLDKWISGFLDVESINPTIQQSSTTNSALQ